MEKEHARSHGLAGRKQLSDRERKAKSNEICQQLINIDLARLLEEFRIEIEATKKLQEQQSVADKQLQEALERMYGVQPVRDPYVAVYSPIGSEVDITPFAQAAREAGCIVCYPAMLRENLMCMVRFDPQDPHIRDFEFLNNPKKITKLDVRKTTCRMVSPEDLDIIIVPLVAYDENRFFISRGGAIYDRFIPRTSLGVRVIGVGFEEQQIDFLTPAAHDCQLRKLVTA